MDVYEIIGKSVLEQAEMQFVVEQYILKRKHVNVTINIPVRSAWEQLVANQQLIKLDQAYTCAVIWFNQQSYKQSL